MVPDTKPGVGRGIQHIPAFGFSAGHPILPGLVVIRMDLNGQLLTCENIFDQERQVAVLFGSKPDFTDASAIARCNIRWNISPAPWLFDSPSNQAMYRHIEPSLTAFPLITLLPALFFGLQPIFYSLWLA